MPGRIREYLEQHQIPIESVALRCGIPPDRLKAMLYGRMPMPAEEYYRICRALHLPVDYFAHSA